MDTAGPTTSQARRSPAAARRFGYAVSIAVNIIILYAATVWPGWRAVPFLTDATRQLMPLFVASVVTGIAMNLIWILWDPRWLTALGNLATAGIGVALGILTWQVFPFDFGSSPDRWTVLARVLIALTIVGCAIGALVSAAMFLFAVARGAGKDARPTLRGTG